MTKYVLLLAVCVTFLNSLSKVEAAPTEFIPSEMKCVAVDNSVIVSLLRDGGEETLEVKSQNQTTEKFLILQRDSRQIVAIKDGDVYGGKSKRGAVLIFNAYGSSYLAFDGELILVKCQ